MVPPWAPNWEHVVGVTLSCDVLVETCAPLGLTLTKVFHHESIGDASGVVLEVVGDQSRADADSKEASQIESGRSLFACPSAARLRIVC